jgi:hypothetical protein
LKRSAFKVATKEGVVVKKISAIKKEAMNQAW